MWTAAILAGGQGTRLGGCDKGALQVGDRSILARQIGILRPLAAHLFIIGSHAAEQNVRGVEDRIPGSGALGGVYTALVDAPTEQVVAIVCDMPFVSAPLIEALVKAGEDVDVALPRGGHRRHPLCASFQRRVAPHLRRSIDAGVLRIGDALRGLQVREVGPDELEPFNRDGKLLFNVNTPDDFDRACLAAKHE